MVAIFNVDDSGSSYRLGLKLTILYAWGYLKHQTFKIIFEKYLIRRKRSIDKIATINATTIIHRRITRFLLDRRVTSEISIYEEHVKNRLTREIKIKIK